MINMTPVSSQSYQNLLRNGLILGQALLIYNHVNTHRFPAGRHFQRLP